MNIELIGKISGLLVLLSAIPYAVRVYQKKITPNIASWIIWSILGCAIYANYEASGATEDSLNAPFFGMFNPLVITAIALFRGQVKRLKWYDYLCLILGVGAIVIWYFFGENKEIATYALYLSIVGDVCGGIVTFIGVLKEPQDDRPLMWVLYAIGYGLAIFAIKEDTLPSLILPIYMVVTSTLISTPLIRYRIKKEIPFKEWY